jgi:N-acetylmuramate 1-kinase
MEEALRHWTDSALTRLQAVPAAASGNLCWEPLRVEASQRRFYRVRWQPEPAVAEQPTPACSVVVMSSPPALENNGQFVALAGLFAAHDIGVPRLLAADETRGFFLMSDLGDTHFADVYGHPGPEAVLPAALGTLIRLQQIDDPRVPPYTRSRFVDELGLYAQWFLAGLLDAAPPPALAEVFEQLVEATQAQPSCCVHRDFHSRNLLLTADGTVGVVDFQDALVGPVTYDLASLLRDCYYTFPESEVARWRDRYLALTPLPVNRATFARDFDLTALQRQLKAVGIFARLHLRDGRDSHLRHIVPVLERIRDLAASYPQLAALAKHVAAVLPVTRRRLGAPA